MITTIGTSTQCGEPADLLDELDAVEFRQLVIGEDHVDAVVARELERAARRVEELEVELAVDLADDLGEQQAAAEQVVDDEDGVALGAGERQLRDDSRRAWLRGVHGFSWQKSGNVSMLQEACPCAGGALGRATRAIFRAGRPWTDSPQWAAQLRRPAPRAARWRCRARWLVEPELNHGRGERI